MTVEETRKVFEALWALDVGAAIEWIDMGHYGQCARCGIHVGPIRIDRFFSIEEPPDFICGVCQMQSYADDGFFDLGHSDG